jgi:DNA-binding SARP family transcriptional activator
MEVAILGPLVVRCDGREVAIGAAKQRALFTMLLLRRGQLVPIETLMDQLWDGRPPVTAMKVVQVYVSQLRKVLGEGIIDTQPGGYRLRIEPDSLDAARFENLLIRGQALLSAGDARQAGIVLREALAMWRGPPLAEFRFEAFARGEIGRLEELRLVAVELRIEADLAVGQHHAVVAELEPLVREHPTREGLLRLYLLALYRTGRQADALAATRRSERPCPRIWVWTRANRCRTCRRRSCATTPRSPRRPHRSRGRRSGSGWVRSGSRGLRSPLLD